ncbi:hypothetical protein JXA47_08350 [Candidatus Sumerlaeota bacterium]|nr:hypothetical protein [Candidatus Sumerlaeota bacterium]
MRATCQAIATLCAGVSLLSCAHHLRWGEGRVREEPVDVEIINETGEMAMTLAASVDGLTLQLTREVFVEQEIDVIHESDEVIVPWSPYAITQFLLISWNPILWTFPDLWREAEGSDHRALRDWLLLWNPLIRTGGRYEEVTRRVEIWRERERRVHGHRRLPLNQTEVRLQIEAGGVRESLTRSTDNDGMIRIDWGVLPPSLSHDRPLNIRAEIGDRGALIGALF